MKRLLNISVLSLFILAAVGCVKFKTTGLTEVKPLDQIDSSYLKKLDKVNVLEKDSGVIDNFDKSILGWTVSHPSMAVLEKKKGNLVITTNNIGLNYEYLSRTFKPLDFTEASTVVIRAKIDGWKVPSIRMDLLDVNGNRTNMKLNVCKLAPRTGYQDYIFRYSGKFIQNWPIRATVDSTQITGLYISINENSGIPYTGTIYVDEVKVIKEEFPKRD